MTDWAQVFLGVIAVASLATAIVQVAVVVVAGRIARRIERLAKRVEHESGPILGHLNAIASDASRAVSTAVAQVDRADHALADVARRLNDAVRLVEAGIGGTAREGAAIVAGLRAAFSAVRDSQSRRARSRADEEDALFI